MAGNGNLVSKAHIDFVKQKLSEANDKTLSLFDRNLKVMGYITWLLEKCGSKPIVVGGHAVELYTLGNYTTVDIDLILDNREAAYDILGQLGFEKKQGFRHWYHAELGIPIEIPDDILAGSYEKVLTLELEDDFVVYVIGIEDLIMDRVKAAAYWKHESDKEWALLLISANYHEIDFEYLIEEAKKEWKAENNRQVYDLIIKLKQVAKELVKS